MILFVSYKIKGEQIFFTSRSIIIHFFMCMQFHIKTLTQFHQPNTYTKYKKTVKKVGRFITRHQIHTMMINIFINKVFKTDNLSPICLLLIKMIALFCNIFLRNIFGIGLFYFEKIILAFQKTIFIFNTTYCILFPF